ncbi:UNVERIFIED_CONTAM: hypothetical protein RMT77_016543 [Armadillidium vulgare]
MVGEMSVVNSICLIVIICFLNFSQSTLPVHHSIRDLKETNPTCPIEYKSDTGSIKLFTAGKNMPYQNSLADCKTKGHKPFIPKTKEETKHWLDFGLFKSTLQKHFHIPWFPKMYNKFLKKYIWHDGEEHEHYYNSNFSIEDLIPDEIDENGNICISFHTSSFYTQNCSWPHSTFAICECI